MRLKEQAQLLLDQNENLINEMAQKVIKSEELIERAQDQQAATAELLAELDGANEKADDAVKRGDQTLKEAQETLKKLGGIYHINYIYHIIIFIDNNDKFKKKRKSISINYDISFRISC